MDAAGTTNGTEAVGQRARSIGGLTLRRLTGPSLAAAIDDLARLRIAVFREYPYLYDGDPDYEARYLATYLRAADGALIAAFDGAHLVGAATALPLADETPEVVAPFPRHGFDPAEVFYFGESVLLAPYRGRGVGVAFFEERERWARSLGRFRHGAFCAVDRPADHPRRPAAYVPLDTFWRRRGFAPVPGMATEFRWKELDEEAESPKRLVFWMKPLGRASDRK